MKKMSMVPKMISGILAAILIAVVLYSSLPSVWFWIGFEVLAALLVAIGCSGEWYLHHHPAGKKRKEKDEHHKLESRFIAAVVIGVFMEFFLLGHAIPEAIHLENDVAVSNLEAKQAGKDAAASNERAAASEREAGQANERAAITESNNLVLRSNVLALEIKLQPRIITPMQITNFIFLTEKIPKIPIKICAGFNSQMSYAGQIRTMFSLAKFGMDSSASLNGGVTLRMDTTVVRPLGQNWEWPAVIFIQPRTNYNTNYGWNYHCFSEITNGLNRPITLNTNDQDEIFTDMIAVFQQLGISFTNMVDTDWVKPGEWAILIPPRSE